VHALLSKLDLERVGKALLYAKTRILDKLFGACCPRTGLIVNTLLQVDAHLSNFIADLKLRQVDPLAVTPTFTPTHASVQQHSRLAALMLPLTVPNSASEQASTGPQSLQAAVSMPEPLPSASADSQLAETVVAAVSPGKLLWFSNPSMALSCIATARYTRTWEIICDHYSPAVTCS